MNNTTCIKSQLLNLLVLVVLLSLLMVNCTSKGKNIPDVSNIEVPVNIFRFEKDLFELDTNNFETALNVLNEKHGEFSELYFGELLGAFDSIQAPLGPMPYIMGFVKDARLRKLHDTCQIVFKDFEPVEKEFEQAFKFYKYYFPEKPTPQVTTYLSEYHLQSFIYGEDKLAVGVDFFLGEDYPYRLYNQGNPNFSNYLTRSFNKDHLVLKTMEVLVEDIVGKPGNVRLLEFMIESGKKRYILDLLMPHAPDSVVFNQSGIHMDWLEANESQMWAFFVGQEMLYETNIKTFAKYVNPSPSSPGMPPESPGNTATFMGYKIVSSFMERNPNATLEEMIALKDGQAFLNKSKYKPKK